MIGVKLTILMIVITFIYTYLVKIVVQNESEEVRLKILANDGMPKYVFLVGILIILDFIGIIYSVIYLLFFMKW